MRVVFLGSPIEVVPVLEALSQASEVELVGVVSQPAKPVGRKQVLEDPPVASFAKTAGIPTLQPISARDPNFQNELRALKPDLCVTAAYGQILDDAFLKIPRRGTINIHPSKLPAFRGATPVPSALLVGLHETAVTILFTVKKLDAGNIILQKNFTIESGETNGALTARLFRESPSMLMESINKLKDNSFIGTPQDESSVTHCKKIAKEDGLINWNQSAEEVFRKFRAYDPWPGSFTFLGDQRLVVTQMQISKNQAGPSKLGEFVFDKPSKSLLVKTESGLIAILKTKPAGSKEMDAAGFWNGIKNKENLFFRT